MPPSLLYLKLRKVPSLYSPGVCNIVHGVSTVTVTACEPYVVLNFNPIPAHVQN